MVIKDNIFYFFVRLLLTMLTSPLKYAKTVEINMQAYNCYWILHLIFIAHIWNIKTNGNFWNILIIYFVLLFDGDLGLKVHSRCNRNCFTQSLFNKSDSKIYLYAITYPCLICPWLFTEKSWLIHEQSNWKLLWMSDPLNIK